MSNTMKPGEAAEVLGVTTQTLRRYVELGLLSAERTAGGHRRIERESVAQLLARKKEVGPNVTVIEAS